MEFPFDINQSFSERISVLDQNLVASWRSTGSPELQSHIATVIDELGRASAKAQQLSAPITSASKLQSQDHQLYLLKDRESCGGRGVVVGFLKVGYKKLFLLNQQGVHIEAEPLCVLDFYVAENLQRHGYGLELFNFMLQHKNAEPVQMAYDRPSPKLLAFLAKHYSLMQSVPQVNNFVVFEGFFLNRTAVQLRKAPYKKPDGEIKPYSLMEREVVHQEQRTLPWPFAHPQSPQRLVSSQHSHSVSVESSPSRVLPPSASPGSSRDQGVQLPLIERCRTRRSNLQGLAARSSLYSRHMDSRTIGLLDRHLPVRATIKHHHEDQGSLHTGVRPVGDPTYRLASVCTPHSRSQPLRLPPLLASETDGGCSHTSVDSKTWDLGSAAAPCDAAENTKVMGHQQSSLHGNRQPLLETEGARTQRGWWWTAGANCSTMCVKQKQGCRSTRPW
ncbi:alpha-tubulin N-acetyltransferase 1 isoform X2 [Kryptolebias marmoratus]|uniref:alpha-tubulin N-acetyltransferase 1 isoform X2 n=1 Tax=Kryptolebias marmoratus TaxID=37003 RepID=UPI0007F87A36|nr:alpha-tubulin N-acetyltransferase 1 isoform X2 [Kryptolebias marmoratus]